MPDYTGPSTRLDVTATRGTVGARTWSGASTSVVVTETPHNAGVVDLAGALTVARAVAASSSADPKVYASLVRGAGAGIRRYGGDHVQAGVKTTDGWIGRVLDIYRTKVVHGEEGVAGFCVDGVDYLVWPYEALVLDDLVGHPGIRVGGS